jgi:hypothetical protein
LLKAADKITVRITLEKAGNTIAVLASYHNPTIALSGCAAGIVASIFPTSALEEWRE